MATEPGHRRGKTVGASEPFKWLLMADPNPQAQDQRAEVRALDEQIVAAGWEPVGRGRWWSALRYVWPHENPPPELAKVSLADYLADVTAIAKKLAADTGEKPVLLGPTNW